MRHLLLLLAFAAGLHASVVSNGSYTNPVITATSLTPQLASPPAIGSTTPNSGAFTTITASGSVTANASTNTFGNGTALENVVLNGLAATSRDIRFQTAGSLRWFFGCDGTAEGGSNAGSNYFLTARTDAGANIDSPILINRIAAGTITIGGSTSRPVMLGNGSAPAGTFTGNVIWGVQSGAVASASQVGEILSNGQSTYTNFTTTATYQQLATVTVTPGDWHWYATITLSANSSTLTAASNASFALSTTTASQTGSVEGSTLIYLEQSINATSKQTVNFEGDINISASTPYFLNGQATFTAGNPQYVCFLSFKRGR